MIIAFREFEPPGLVKVNLWIGELLDIGVRFRYGAVTSRCAGVDEGEQVGLVVGAENDPSKRRYAVADRPGNKGVRVQAELGQTRFITQETFRITPKRVGVGAGESTKLRGY